MSKSFLERVNPISDGDDGDPEAFPGFSSVLKKIVYSTNIRTRDALMKITLESKEGNTLDSFVVS